MGPPVVIGVVAAGGDGSDGTKKEHANISIYILYYILTCVFFYIFILIFLSIYLSISLSVSLSLCIISIYLSLSLYNFIIYIYTSIYLYTYLSLSIFLTAPSTRTFSDATPPNPYWALLRMHINLPQEQAASLPLH